MEKAMSERINRASVLIAGELTGTKSAGRGIAKAESRTVETKAAICDRYPRFRRLAWILGFCFLLSVLCFVFRAPLLTGLAEAWIVNEPVILGGGLENRPFAAARLFRAGVAPQVLYMNVQLGPAEELGVVMTESEATRRILLSNGVPELSMTAIGNSVSSTYDESRAVREWVEKTGAKSVVIPTDLFHSRRVRWLFRKQLQCTPAQTYVQAVDPIRYQRTNWWQREEGLIAFQNELIKSVYYRLKY